MPVRREEVPRHDARCARLTSSLDEPLDERWRTSELSQRLRDVWRAHQADHADALIDVRALAQVDSTNTRALEAARSDTTSHLRLLVAQSQTAGRGRHGRAWHASPGASLAFSLAVPIAADACASLVVGAAVADAVEPSAGAHANVLLKWPNDLWLRDATSPFGGRKLGGILLETATTAAGRVLVVGIGLNLRAVTPDHAPSYGVASLDEVAAAALGCESIDGPDVLLRAAPAVLTALLRPAADGTWQQAWARRDLLAGRRIEAGTANERLTGVARGINDAGALLMQRDSDGQIVVVSSGEVSVRPLALS